MLVDLIEHLSRRVWLWTQVRQLNDMAHLSPRDLLQFSTKQHADAYDFMRRGMLVLRGEAQLFLLGTKSERQIATERLARRYDPGQAMSEAFQRAETKIREGRMQQAPLSTPSSDDPAIHQHYENMRKHPVELTPRQKAALQVQQQTLRKNLDSQ